MMIVEMGHQMKDLHTLLHYLPIIGYYSVSRKLIVSVGGSIDVDLLYYQCYLRKTFRNSTMGKAGGLLPECAQLAPASVK